MTLYEDLNILFTKKDGEIKSPPYILNRFLSFSSKTYGVARRLDRYMFHLGNDMLLKIMIGTVPKMRRAPWFNYVKKSKEKEAEFDFIMRGLQEYFNWTDKKLGVMKPLILQLCEDKKALKEMMDFMGTDLKLYKKYKIPIDKPKPTGLGRWMK